MRERHDKEQHGEKLRENVCENSINNAKQKQNEAGAKTQHMLHTVRKSKTTLKDPDSSASLHNVLKLQSCFVSYSVQYIRWGRQ